MPDSTAQTPTAPEKSPAPARPEGLHYTRARERYDKIGARRGSFGSRFRYTVYDGERRLETYYDKRLADRHVAGLGVVLEMKGQGYVVWKGAARGRFDTLKDAQAFARGKGAAS